MPRWLRVIRGMVGTGLAFTVGGGLVGLLVGTPIWLFGELSALDIFGVAARFAVVAFPIGVAFSGLLALTARGGSFEKLSIPRVAALGAGVGLLCFAVIGVNGFRVWSVPMALLNLTSLLLMGGGSAAGILLLARRAGANATSEDASRGSSESMREVTAGAGSFADAEVVEHRPEVERVRRSWFKG